MHTFCLQPANCYSTRLTSHRRSHRKRASKPVLFSLSRQFSRGKWCGAHRGTLLVCRSRSRTTVQEPLRSWRDTPLSARFANREVIVIVVIYQCSRQRINHIHTPLAGSHGLALLRGSMRGSLEFAPSRAIRTKETWSAARRAQP